MRRLVPLLPLFALAACVSYPIVVPSAFAPAPRKIAVLRYETGMIGGAQAGLISVPVSDVATPYDAFKQALFASKMFLVADDRLIAANPVYLSQPLESIVGVSLPPLLRPIVLSPVATPALAQSLGADVLLVVHNWPEVVYSSSFGPLGSAHVRLATRLAAYASNGTLIWRDRFVTDSSDILSVAGIRDPVQLQHVTSQVLANAAQNAVGRLTIALAQR
ncbi:MAG: hypothetical protein ACYCWW_06520 [Deltaproteobacteria bacterium]